MIKRVFRTRLSSSEAKPHPCAQAKPHPGQEPILILPGQLPGQNIEVTSMPHPLHAHFLVSPHPLSLLPWHLPGHMPGQMPGQKPGHFSRFLTGIPFHSLSPNHFLARHRSSLNPSHYRQETEAVSAPATATPDKKQKQSQPQPLQTRNRSSLSPSHSRQEREAVSTPATPDKKQKQSQPQPLQTRKRSSLNPSHSRQETEAVSTPATPDKKQKQSQPQPLPDKKRKVEESDCINLVMLPTRLGSHITDRSSSQFMHKAIVCSCCCLLCVSIGSFPTCPSHSLDTPGYNT